MSTIIVGISAYYHDSAAALIVDGVLISAAQEERFTRKKHDSSFPVNALIYVVKEAGLKLSDISAIVFYEKPFIKFERLLESFHAFAPRGLVGFLSAAPAWIQEKLFMKKMLKDELEKLGVINKPLLFPEHHLSHASSAFYPSPFEAAAILTLDGVGEWATTTIGQGKGNKIRIISELHFPHSLGLLYSAFTYYTGFAVNSGEYKLMGLAPYGNPEAEQTHKFREIILTHLVDIRSDGSFLLNMNYFCFATGLKMSCDNKWIKLFGIPPRKPETEISQPYMNMALAIQQVTEEIVLKLAKTAKELTQSDYLVMAGGVALNSVANGKLLNSGIFKDIWIQPAAGDAGGALGAAYLGWYLWKGKERVRNSVNDDMHGTLLGPSYSGIDIQGIISRYDLPHLHFENFNELLSLVAGYIAEGNIVGWFQGRMEFGPRALGNRSILGDARNPEMQKRMNLKIKKREGFRPFAPVVLEEDIADYFELDRPSPYMLFVVPVKQERTIPLPEDFVNLSLNERLYFKRSDIPAVTHLDYSARVQSVNKDTNPRFWSLLTEFKRQTNCSVLLNTSFNVRGEPIVCTPHDAFRCFMKTEMDFLVLGNYLFDKNDLRELLKNINWQDEVNLD
ncbi:carbamoyltransferase [Bacteroidota bacterium]